MITKPHTSNIHQANHLITCQCLSNWKSSLNMDGDAMKELTRNYPFKYHNFQHDVEIINDLGFFSPFSFAFSRFILCILNILCILRRGVKHSP